MNPWADLSSFDISERSLSASDGRFRRSIVETYQLIVHKPHKTSRSSLTWQQKFAQDRPEYRKDQDK